MGQLDDELRAANVGTSESLAAHMARGPEPAPLGCEACSFSDNGCSACRPEASALDLLREHDDAEAVFDQAIAAKVAAAPGGLAVEPLPAIANAVTPPSQGIELAFSGGTMIVKVGPARLVVPVMIRHRVGEDGSSTYAAIAPDVAHAAVEAFCRATGYYPTPPGGAR